MTNIEQKVLDHLKSLPRNHNNQINLVFEIEAAKLNLSKKEFTDILVSLQSKDYISVFYSLEQGLITL